MVEPNSQQDSERNDTYSAAATSAAPRREIGTLLRRRREELGWELAAVAKALRIREEYLAALERNTLDGLPGAAYALGFLRAYADYLGLDGGQAARRFKEEKSALSARTELIAPMPLTDRGLPGGGLVLLTTVIIVALGFGAWYYFSTARTVALPTVEPVPAQLAQLVAPPPKPPAPAVKPPVAPTVPVAAKPLATGAVAPPPVGTAPSTPAPPVAAAAPVSAVPASVPPAPAQPTPAAVAPPAMTPTTTPGRIVLSATRRCWVEVRGTKKILMMKVLAVGETYTVPDEPGLFLRIGNAGGLTISVDGKALPTLGRMGERKSYILDPQRLLAGTAAHSLDGVEAN